MDISESAGIDIGEAADIMLARRRKCPVSLILSSSTPAGSSLVQYFS